MNEEEIVGHLEPPELMDLGGSNESIDPTPF